ncbi:unnamed protein product, partial [Medioppia subpectinata]
IYNKCICGLLLDKTKIVSTHHHNYLVKADLVLKLESGQIVTSGSPESVLKFKDKSKKEEKKCDEDLTTIEDNIENELKLKEEEREEGVVKLDVARVLFFDLTAFGRIINRFSSDVFNVDDGLPFTLNIFLSQMYSLLASLLITRYYRWTSRELKRLSAVSLSPIYTQLDETLQGLVTIRAFANTNRFMREMYRKLDVNNKIQYSSGAVGQWLNLRLQLLGNLISSGVALLAVGLHFWLHQTLDSGLVGLALVYSLSVTGLLNGAVQSFTQTEMDMIVKTDKL